MLPSPCTALFLLMTLTFVTTQANCPKGCKCKSFGYCYDCDTGYYRQGNECIKCSTNCQSCSSYNTCKTCESGYYTHSLIDSNVSCHPCSSGCTQCNSEKNCLQCNAGYFIKDNVCTTCKPGCKTCDSESICSACVDGYVLNSTSCQKCPEGYFVSGRSSCLPCPNNCVSCSNFNNCTKCKKGFFDKQCVEKCSSGCEGNVCDEIMGNCTCKRNYNGSNCNQCKPGKYGLDCTSDCPERCLTCNSTEKCTLCKNGYFGIKCSCSFGCLNNKCDLKTGQCLKCKPFFEWPCRECVKGKWGKNCTNDCQAKCLRCLSHTNCTKCKDGYYNSKGQCLSCPTNCLNASCKSPSGICDHGCTTGYWGKICDKPCSKNCINGTCQNENGTCTLGCKNGYHGYMCNCPNTCICNSSGHCILGCRTFEDGAFHCGKGCYSVCLNCSQDTGTCERCGNNTFYGQFCDKECSKTCTDRSCDSLTGRCTLGCMEGYFGDQCNRQCNSSCRAQSCDRETGFCDFEAVAEESSFSLSQHIRYVLLSISFATLTIAIIISIVLVVNRHRTKHKRRVRASLAASFIYEQEMNSDVMQVCEREVQNDPNGMKLNSLERGHNVDSAVLDGAAPIICEPSTQGNVYVNVEYASIERKQFVIKDEESEDEDEELFEDDNSEEEDDFLYANTEEYLKRRVPVYQLYEFVKNKTEDDYAGEFKNLPTGLIKPFNESQKEDNLMKNRYRGVYPYDSRRVIVRDRQSDYINASYVDGYKKQKAYIASLGPTVKQMGADFGVFWNMVWQEKVCKIVMLTNLKEQGVKKCDKYWPDKDVCCIYEDVKVQCQSEEIYPYFTVRVFSVEKIEKRILYQMHFTAWPDKSTPKDVHSIIEFWEKLTRIPKFELGPIIVHCSAGVGRTGTFIALDILANEGVSEGTVDIFACVRNLREDRVCLIQTLEQYRFLHEALVQLLFSDTSVKALLTNDENVHEKMNGHTVDEKK